MRKKLVGYLVFFVILTCVFFYFVFAGTDNWKAKLPTVSYVKPFSFTNQDGKTIDENDLKGKVTVVEYFFTTCKGICPKLNKSLNKIYDEFKDEPDFLILAHTVQPETDSVARLRFYADSMKIDTKKWMLLTGRKDSLYKAARGSYLLDDPANNVEKLEDQFIHTQFLALVDKSGNVRGGVYDALKKDEMEKLRKDIAGLLKEKPGPNGFVNGVFGNHPQ
ncbi:MAG TPA: SCO family protein [Segetibacter sp.]|nr:SCO family protein [Segetibacter sp.]